MRNFQSYRWRVWYLDGTSRDVAATSRRGALRTAEHAARVVGVKAKAGRKAGRAECLFAIGTPPAGAQHPLLSPPEDTDPALLEPR